MKVSELASEIGAAKFWIGAIVVGTLSLNGIYQFLREAPAIVSSNAEHIGTHHDTIVDLSHAVEAFQLHALEEDSTRAVYGDRIDRLSLNVDYLVCLRRQRARELDSLPRDMNCEEVLLDGN